MTKKHFEAAAAKIRGMYEHANSVRSVNISDAVAIDREASAIRDFFINLACEFNPRFDSARFEAACLPE